MIALRLLVILVIAVGFTIILAVFSLWFKRLGDRRHPIESESEDEPEPFFYRYEVNDGPE